jgi:signal transduction histidine kinase
MFGLKRIERSRRDWIVDVSAVLVSLLFGFLFQQMNETAHDGPKRELLWDMDLYVGPLFCLAVWFRRRWLTALAILSIPITAISLLGGVAAGIVLFTVAIHRPAKQAYALGVAQFAAALVNVALYPTKDTDLWVAVTLSALVTLGVVAWGMYIRARRALLAELRERAERAEAEQQLMADRAREAERTRIAREMHDVLAHRVTLIALHAGALEVNPDAPPEEVERSAALIRSTARLAMEDLRSVIGVLRGSESGDGAEAPPSRPQPTLGDIPRLVQESRDAGERVELVLDVDEVETLPDATGRDAFRIVQEALTNVHKHARGTATSVMLGGRPGEGLTIEVRNRMPIGATVGATGTVPTVPGSGTGLVGLAERVALSAGTLTHGPDSEGGDFVVRALLRWSV